MRARAVPGLARAAGNLDVWPDHGCERGDFEIETRPNGQRYLWLACPGDCQMVSPLPIRPHAGSGASWELSGTPEAPTLSPSVHHVGCWHGWLRAGELVVA